MKKLAAVFAVVLCAGLSACVSTASLKQNAPQLTADVDKPLKEVYRLTRTMVRDCHSYNAVTAQMMMEDDIDEDAGTAEIKLIMKGITDQVNYVIDMQAVGAGRTHLEFYGWQPLFGPSNQQRARDATLHYLSTKTCN